MTKSSSATTPLGAGNRAAAAAAAAASDSDKQQNHFEEKKEQHEKKQDQQTPAAIVHEARKGLLKAMLEHNLMPKFSSTPVVMDNNDAAIITGGGNTTAEAANATNEDGARGGERQKGEGSTAGEQHQHRHSIIAPCERDYLESLLQSGDAERLRAASDRLQDRTLFPKEEATERDSATSQANKAETTSSTVQEGDGGNNTKKQRRDSLVQQQLFKLHEQGGEMNKPSVVLQRMQETWLQYNRNSILDDADETNSIIVAAAAAAAANSDSFSGNKTTATTASTNNHRALQWKNSILASSSPTNSNNNNTIVESSSSSPTTTTTTNGTAKPKSRAATRLASTALAIEENETNDATDSHQITAPSSPTPTPTPTPRPTYRAQNSIIETEDNATNNSNAGSPVMGETSNKNIPEEEQAQQQQQQDEPEFSSFGARDDQSSLLLWDPFKDISTWIDGNQGVEVNDNGVPMDSSPKTLSSSSPLSGRQKKDMANAAAAAANESTTGAMANLTSGNDGSAADAMRSSVSSASIGGGGGGGAFRILGTAADDVSCHPHVLSPPLMESLLAFVPESMQDYNYWLKYSLVRDGANFWTLLRQVRASNATILAIETSEGHVFGCFTGQSWRLAKGWYGSSDAFLWKMRRSRLETTKSIVQQAMQESEIQVFPFRPGNVAVQYCSKECIMLGRGELLMPKATATAVAVPSSQGQVTQSSNASSSAPQQQQESQQQSRAPPGSQTMETNAQKPAAVATAGATAPSSKHYGHGLYLQADLLRGSTSTSETFGNPCLVDDQLRGAKFEVENLEVWTLTPHSNSEQAQQSELSQLFLEGGGDYPKKDLNVLGILVGGPM